MRWRHVILTLAAAVAIGVTACQVPREAAAPPLPGEGSPLPGGSSGALVRIREGTISLVFAEPTSEARGWFDFDSGEYVPGGKAGTDIRAGLALGSGKFLVIAPVGAASGVHLLTETAAAADTSAWEGKDCAQQETEYLPGAKPVAYEGDVFCWLTTEGNLVKFRIMRLRLAPGEDAASVKYVVWALP